jgi:AraC-like DNA-binding protein
VSLDTDAHSHFKPLRFSTDFLPARDRMAIWREVIGLQVSKLDLSPLTPDGTFRSDMVARNLADVTVVELAITGVRSQRTRGLLADGNDDVLLVLMQHAPDGEKPTVVQFGRETTLSAGEAALISNADESTVVAPGFLRGVSVRLPRKALAALVPNLEDTFNLPIPASNEALQLIGSYVSAIDRMTTLADPNLRSVVAAHLRDLVAAAVLGPNAATHAADVRSRRGVGAARLETMKLDIVRNIGRRDISAEWIASLHGISPGYVRRLFEAEEITFTEFLLATRLSYAHRLLCDPQHIDRTISSIAFAAGFGDLSYFNRAFRRRYGASPSDVRQATAARRNA